MRRVALRILNLLREESLRIEELANRLEKSRSWISNVVGDLAEENLVEKDGRVKLADTYEASLLAELMNSYRLEEILAGRREDILEELLGGAKSAGELESEGVPKSTVYSVLRDLRAMGVVEEKGEGHEIADETLREFLKVRKRPVGGEYTADGERILVLENAAGEEGPLTAFSAFDRYGVDYYPVRVYMYRGGEDLGPEDVLIHAVLCAENKKQMAACGVFYLKNREDLETDRLWDLSEKWDCTERLADLLAYLGRREGKGDLFLPWGEFETLTEEYGVSLRGEHPRGNLLASLERVGGRLDAEADAYLLGGANLIFRGLKDATKDVDVLLENGTDFDTLVGALEELGYEEKLEVERAYEELEPGAVMERRGSPRWDIFVEDVAGCLRLTGGLRERSEEFERAGKLHIRLISPTDMFLFKAVTNRAGDLEDAALIVRSGEVDWGSLLEEIERQEEITGKHLSFPVLDTLDLLSERYGIEVPVHGKLESHCLERALMVTLEEPKTIKDLREEMDFPEHQIYNKLRKLEEEDRIEVDRSGKLNEYRARKFQP